jgi:predicted AAA+ superfamily ATPase
MKRYLNQGIIELALRRGKMAFISGPRQVGKTTLSKSYMNHYQQAEYKNWDESQFRKLWTKSPNLLQSSFRLEKSKDECLLILDEIHKGKGWKQKLKGLYDEFSDKIQIIVTGSARLNIFKKGGDSLMGRFLNFRLHPFSYGEVCNNEIFDPDKWKSTLFKKTKMSRDDKNLLRLLEMSGFPEPYLANSQKILKIWRQSRNEKIVREDLRDLSRIPELSQVEMLTSLLPEKVGSPLSVQSLREDLEVSHDTVKRWLNYLNELYYFFELKPWSKSVPRSLKKEGKVYLYDWTEIENEGFKFENLIACHLQKACHYWTDTGEGLFDLYYLRNKEKEEIDFLIVKDKKPWLMVEAKNKDTNLNNKVIDKFIKYFQCPYIQVINEDDIFFKKDDQKLIISAVDFLAHLP